MEEKYRQYDELLATLMQNIQVEAARDEGIYIYGYGDNYLGNVYMQLVNAYADLTQSKVTMIMPLVPYIKFKLKNWKSRKRYRWTWMDKGATPINLIARFVATHHNQPLDIYKDIYNEYYK